MDLDDVEKCLKAAKKSDPKPAPTKTKGSRVKPTALAAQLMFDNNSEQINDVLTNIASELDKDEVRKKAEKIDIDVNDLKLQIHTEPITEVIATELSTEDDFGGIIRAEVQAPGELYVNVENILLSYLKRNTLISFGVILQKLQPC